MHKTLLFIGTGQVGKAILNKFVEDEPEKIIIHNLTKKESDKIVNEYASQYTDITFISSFGNIFMPFELKDLDNKNLSNSSEKISKTII